MLIFKSITLFLRVPVRESPLLFVLRISKCKSHSCFQTFEIFIEDPFIGTKSVVVRIRAVGDDSHNENGNVERYLIRKDRYTIGKIVDSANPLKVFQQKVENANKEMLCIGNFIGCESIEV